MNRPMRVALLNGFDERGGAARAALRLHRGLRAGGVESRLLVQRRFGHEPGVEGPHGGLPGALAWLRPRLESIPVRLYPRRGPSLFSGSFLPDGLRSRIDAFAPDVLHVHWVGFGFLRPETLAAVAKPTLWTLHDSWAFTGGCHLPGTCVRYRESCGACPALGSSAERDLSRRVFERKRRAWRGRAFTVVSPSRWLADAARSSALFHDAEIVVVPNGIDLETFHPIDRDEARRRLGLDPERFVIFFSALEGLSDENKGFSRLQEALERLAARGLADRFLLLVVGLESPRDPPRSAVPIRFAGRLDTEAELALHLAAADALALPSRQENQPNLVVEAMACARPAVAFRTTGLPELVVHRETGYLAEPFRADDLAAGIAWLAERPERAADLGRRARERAESAYAVERMVNDYAALYEAALEASGARPRDAASPARASGK